MPIDPAGNYTLPPVYRATPGTTIRAEQHNGPLEDIAQALSNSLRRDGRNGMLGNLNLGSFQINNLKPGTAPTDAATVSQSVPIGAIMDFAGDNPPAGWMLCAGQAIARSTYPHLFALLGTKYGAGNGSTTFNLPDIRGRVRAGKDNMGGAAANVLSLFGALASTLGGRFGADRHQLTQGEMPSHGHGVNDPGHAHNYIDFTVVGGNGYAGGGQYGASTPTRQTAGSGTGIWLSNAGGNQAHPNVQPTIILNTIIKATY